MSILFILFLFYSILLILICDFLVSECKKRWTSLRDQYRRNVIKRKTVSGQSAVTRVKWRFEDTLSFLSPHMKERTQKSNLDTGNSSDSHDNSINITHDDETNQFSEFRISRHFQAILHMRSHHHSQVLHHMQTHRLLLLYPHHLAAIDIIKKIIKLLNNQQQLKFFKTI